MNAIMTATTVLNVVSALLLFVLLAVYIKNLSKVKSKLLYGLILFVLVFLVKILFELYHAFTMMMYYVPEVEKLVFIQSILQSIALGIMLFITWD